MIGTLGFVSHELSFVWYGQTPLGCVEVTKATRERVPVEPICVHFRAPLKKWGRHKSKDHQRISETKGNCQSGSCTINTVNQFPKVFETLVIWGLGRACLLT